MLKAIIFDVDGTIANTERLHLRAFNWAFTNLGMPFTWDIKQYQSLLQICGGKERIFYYLKSRLPIEDKAKLFELSAKLHALKTKIYVELLNDGELEFRENVRELMIEALENNIALAIATTTTPANIDALMKPVFGTNWHLNFSSICDGKNVPNKKPHSAVYWRALGELGVVPRHSLAIEDSENGLRAAMGAKIPTLITTNEFTEDQNFDGALMVSKSLKNAADLMGHNNNFTLSTARALMISHHRQSKLMVN